MSNIFRGDGVLWGMPGLSAQTLTGLGSMKLIQSAEYNYESDEEPIRDNVGNTSQVTKYDHRAKATLEFIPTSSSNTGTITIASVGPSIGATLAVTDAEFTPIGATWIVDGISYTRGNTKALLCRVNLSRYLTNSLP